MEGWRGGFRTLLFLGAVDNKPEKVFGLLKLHC